MRSLLVFVLILALTGALVGTVRAQGFREAEIEFARGELYLEMKDYPRAVFSFKKAYSLVPDVRYQAGIVQAYYQMGENEKALIFGDSLLSPGSVTVDGDVAAVIQKLLAEISEVKSKVVVTFSPDGGSLSITTAGGTEPATIVQNAQLIRWLPHGEAVLRYEKDGFVATEQRVSLSKGRTESLYFALEPATGESELVVQSNVENARVYLDGTEIGRTPLKIRLESGSHLLQVWTENHLAWTGAVDAPAGRAVSVNANLAPAGEQVSVIPTAELAVQADSGWALSTWGWITSAGGLGLLGGAGYFYYVAFSKTDEANQEKDKAKSDELAQDAQTNWTIAMILGAAGGIAMGGGLLMVLLDDGDEEGEAAPFEILSLSPAIGPDVIGFEAALSF